MKLYEQPNGEWIPQPHDYMHNSIESTDMGLIIKTIHGAGYQNCEVEVEVPWTAIKKFHDIYAYGWQVIDKNETHVLWQSANGAQFAVKIGEYFDGCSTENIRDLRARLGERGWIGGSMDCRMGSDKGITSNDYVPRPNT